MMSPSNKLAAVVLVLAAACGTDSAGIGTALEDPDASIDGGRDAGKDVSVTTEGGTDATTPDATTEGGLDAAKDSAPDVVDDASDGGDAGDASDAGDADPDAGTDASDAGDAGDAEPTDASDASVDASDASDAEVDAGPIDCDGGTTTLASASGFATVSTFSDDGKLILPGSIVGDGNRRFWIQDPAGNGASGDKMIDLSATGAATEWVLPNTAALCTVSQVTRDSFGNGYVFDTFADVIYKTTPAGVVSSFSNVGGVGGGGNCDDSGVIGLLARADNSFFVGSPLNDKIYTLTADGATRADFADVTAPGRLEHDGANGLYVVSGNQIKAVSSGGVVTTRLDVGMPMMALRRDANGDLYFSNGKRLYRSASGTSTFREVAACFPGNIVDVVFDRPSDDAGASTSLYVLTTGETATAHDSGDKLLELKR